MQSHERQQGLPEIPDTVNARRLAAARAARAAAFNAAFPTDADKVAYATQRLAYGRKP
jgi:hypothetical protein